MRVVAMVVLAFAPAAHAQDGSAVTLRLHPKMGDTLHTRLEQQTEVSATMPAGMGGGVRSVLTSVAIHSRTIVRTVMPSSTIVLTIVDSASLTSTDAHAEQQIAEARRSLRGQQLVLQLGSDGTVESARDSKGVLVPRDVAEAMAAMPAVFPRKAVAVGDEWMREMPLPSGGPPGARGAAHVRATFHLDSLQRSGPIAFVSMRGEITPDSASRGVEISGSITGAMQLDRSRGWMTDSRFVVLVRSAVMPPAGSGLAPMHVLTRVTQRLRTMDKR